MLCWTCETLTRSTFRNLTDSYEGWAYRNGFHRQLRRLEQQQMIERRSGKSGDRFYRLTEPGHLNALGGRNPEACWNRSWDGRWRLVLFDLPESHRRQRDRLRHYLRHRGFGYLQNSAWITPDHVNEHRAFLTDGIVNVESLIFLEARPSTGETDAEIVAGAWDFPELYRRYAQYLNVLHHHPRRSLHTLADANNLQRWLRAERESWINVMEADPLLPRILLPPNYPGQTAWRERLTVMAEAGRQMRSFSPE